MVEQRYLQLAEHRKEWGFLFVGPPGDRLYKQGKCRICEIPIFGKEPVHKDLCNDDHCGIEATRKNPCKFKRLRNETIAQKTKAPVCGDSPEALGSADHLKGDTL